MSKITKIVGRQVFDSRGNPTVEAEVFSKKKQPVKGKLLGISGNLVKLFMDGETFELDITTIKKANLVVDGLMGDSGK